MSTDHNDTTSAPSGGLRRNLLLAVLGLLIIALAYDFAIARPAVEDAYATVTEKNLDFNAERKHQAMLDTHIQELLGRKPDHTFEDHGLHVEVYSWRAGLPFRTHNLYVVYRPIQGTNYFVRLTKFAHDPEAEFQAVPEGPVNGFDVQDEMADAPAPAAPGESEPDGSEASDDAAEEQPAPSEESEVEAVEETQETPETATP